nr:unnamed protein product [Naegleria fowleri]
MNHTNTSTTPLSSTNSYSLQVDFKVHSRSPHISFQKNHKAIPLYKGRALVSLMEPSPSSTPSSSSSSFAHNSPSSAEEHIRLVAVSSLLSEALYFDSQMNSYTRVRFEPTTAEQKGHQISVYPSPVEFNSLLKSILDTNHYIPEQVPIYDEAADRLCPVEYFDRYVVFFEHSHYLLCMKKEKDTTASSVSPRLLSMNGVARTRKNSLMNLKYIIGQEFTVDIASMSLRRGELGQLNNARTRGGSNLNRSSRNDNGNNIMSLYTESPLIQEELKAMKTQSTSESLNRISRAGVLEASPQLEDYFPKTKVQLVEKSSSEKGLLQSEQYTSPAKSYFFHLDSIACLLPWLKDSKKCSQQNSMREQRALDESKRKVCVFLHGAGQWPSDITPSEVVKNVIIYAHSMGNLILAAAIKNGVCSLDKESVSWYDLMGPLRGSPAANMLDTVCAQDDWNVKRILAAKGGYCMSDSMKMYPTYESLHTNYSGLSDIQKVAKEYITGQMCGTSSYGLNSMYSAPLELLSKLVNYGELNDGLVPYSSCVVDKDAPFSESYEDTFYRTAANHVDGTWAMSLHNDTTTWITNNSMTFFMVKKVLLYLIFFLFEVNNWVDFN